jgi:membrane associated rhomboid family serine protease
MATHEQTQTQVCYRHPNRETGVSCSNCGRPICPDCMVYAAVGIKCPECAGQTTVAARKAQRSARARPLGGTGGITVTKVLVAANVVVYLLAVASSSGGFSPSDQFIIEWGLFGPAVADGEWWRLITAAFLHANLIHILFNMLMLWWFGQALEAAVGPVRFAGIYAVSALAGSAGALLLAPETFTVGASGAVFGILGAGLVLERQQIWVFGGSALGVVVLNVVFSFLISSISIGGHIGGLVGGALATLVLSRFGRGHAVYGRIDAFTVAGLVAVAALSVAVAYLSVRGLAPQ